jgi:DNA helicase-2/ATP-dependent DNA helicase PcrA
VDLLVPYGSAPTGMMTFHAFGQQLLDEHGLRLGLSGPGEILSGAALMHHFKKRLWELPLQRFRPLGNPGKHALQLSKVFSRAKDQGLDPQAWAVAAQLQRDTATTDEEVEEALDQLELAACYGAYQGFLRQDGFLDHGDQLLLALRLLEQHPSVLARVRAAYPVVLVDEFQDTNTVQARLLKALCPAESTPELTVVGDDDQAIYGFRGASLANLLHFKDSYPKAAVVTLNQNYRCVQEILDASYRLIRHNDPDRLEVTLGIEKKLLGQASLPGAVAQHPFEDQNTELAFVAKQILKAHAEGVAFKDQAVLVRSHAVGQEVMDVLTRAKIPLRYPGDRGLYRQPEVQRALAFVRALATPNDDRAIFDLLIHAPEPWDLLQVKHLLGEAQHRNLALWRALDQPDLLLGAGVDDKAVASAKALLEQLRVLGKLATHQGVAPALYRYLQESGVLERLMNQGDDEGERAVANLARFFERLKDFDRVEQSGNVPAVAEYLEALLEEGDDPATEQAGPDEDAVTVSTVHQAKGLEWAVVYLPGLEELAFPQKIQAEGLHLPRTLLPLPADKRVQHLAEERRLFYVAMTRAKRHLILSHSVDHGGSKAWKRSAFIGEALALPPEPKAPGKLSPRQRLDAYADHPHPLHKPMQAKLAPDGSLRLTYYPTDDYLSCPFKYKIAHVLGLKPPPDQSLAYGNAFHTAIQAYHRARMDQQVFGWPDLEAAFKAAWSSIGFASPKHEAERLAKGLVQLQSFFEEEEASGLLPWRIEHKFDAPLDPHTRLVGRMDRVDKLPDGSVVISDYKTSNVQDQDKADKEVKASLQLAIYALAYQAENGALPNKLELRFLEFGLRASLVPDEKYITKKRDEILEAAAGIRAGDFHPIPGFHCKFCAYHSVCPHADGKE